MQVIPPQPPNYAAGGDLTGTYPNATLAAYRTIARSTSRAQASNVTGAATYAAATNGSVLAATGAGTTSSPFLLPLKPTDWAATGFSTKLRLLVGCNVTDTAPGITFTWGLYPVSAIAGGTTLTNLTLGAVLTGSTVVFATPAANSIAAETSSGDFAFPAAGLYVVAVAASGAMTANSNPTFTWALQVRNV